MISIAIFTGFASLAGISINYIIILGIGGGGVVVSFLTMFFNYS